MTLETASIIESESSPLRLRLALCLGRVLVAGKPVVEGLDNLDNLDQQPLIIATTHLTDMDIPIAASVLSSRLNLAMTDMSPNHSWSDPGDKIILKVAGETSFTPIDFNVGKKNVRTPAMLNPDNFKPMLGAIERGKRLVIAAHSPSKNGDFPDKPGIAVPYLAMLSGARILPVAVAYQHPDKRLGMAEHPIKTVLTHAGVKVSIGKTMKLAKAPEKINELAQQSKNDARMRRLSREDWQLLKGFLRNQGVLIVNELKSLNS